MNQFTLKQIPDNVYKQIKLLAKKNHTSINKTLLFLIKKSLGSDDISDKKRDLYDLEGTWTENEYNEFNTNMKIFDQIDSEGWKR